MDEGKHPRRGQGGHFRHLQERGRPLSEASNIGKGEFVIYKADSDSRRVTVTQLPSIKAGNVLQGQQKSGEVKIANVGKSPVRIAFKDVDAGLRVSVSPETIPAGGTATLTYTVTTDRAHWGKCWYYATPTVDGKPYKALEAVKTEKRPERGAEALVADPNPEIGAGRERIGFWVVIKEDFSALTREQRARPPTSARESLSSIRPTPTAAASPSPSSRPSRPAARGRLRPSSTPRACLPAKPSSS